MSKEMFIACHNKCAEEYMEKHPDALWAEAYARTADQAYDRVREHYADMIDTSRKRAKDEAR